MIDPSIRPERTGICQNTSRGPDHLKTLTLLSILLCASGLSKDLRAQPTVIVHPSLEDTSGTSAWTFDGSGVWNISGGMLVLSKAGVPSGPIRRPAALAILQSYDFVNVTVQAQIRSTAPLDVPRRDLDVILDYESPSRFYYVHLAGITDPVHNGIFLVADADRRRIDDGTGKPQLTDQNWHSVRVERNAATGRIAVYSDSLRTAVFTAADTTLHGGRVGFGSFDDTGEFRGILITGSPREIK